MAKVDDLQAQIDTITQKKNEERDDITKKAREDLQGMMHLKFPGFKNLEDCELADAPYIKNMGGSNWCEPRMFTL